MLQNTRSAIIRRRISHTEEGKLNFSDNTQKLHPAQCMKTNKTKKTIFPFCGL